MDGFFVLMQRRTFLGVLGWGSLVISCDTGDGSPPGSDDGFDPPDAATPPSDGATADACVATQVALHDTNAQALYLDGSLGPLTGVIRVADITAGSTLTTDFWHGHGGTQHRFTLTPEIFEQLKRGEKVTVGTTTVDGHSHTLFIDPRDERYRVTGAPDVLVDLGC